LKYCRLTAQLPDFLPLFVFVFYCQCAWSFFYSISFLKAEVFLEGMGHPGASSLNHALLHHGRWIVFLFVLENAN